jgi:hypothetical protein
VDRHTRDLYDRCAALRERSARLRADVTTLRDKHAHIKEQMTIQRENAPATGGVVYDAPLPTPHEMAIEALHLIGTIIDPFPLEWQIRIVKALTARTLAKAHERTRPAQAVISA